MEKRDDQIFGTNAGLFDPFPQKQEDKEKQEPVHGLGTDAGLFETNGKEKSE